jgi:putative methylase
MKQRELEMALQKLEGFPDPDPALEQYPTPARIAADMLYTAYGFGDIGGKHIIDLGCGTGVFSIGACLLGAEKVLGLDKDDGALGIAIRNAASNNCAVDFICEDVSDASGKYDTCVMNPPFGSQKRHADVPFLEKAAELADVTYSLHNAETFQFLCRKIRDLGRIVDLEKRYKLEIRHTFRFHTKEKAMFDVALIRTVRE